MKNRTLLAFVLYTTDGDFTHLASIAVWLG